MNVLLGNIVRHVETSQLRDDSSKISHCIAILANSNIACFKVWAVNDYLHSKVLGEITKK